MSCYLIAEIGGNFLKIDEAKRLIDAAAAAGVDAVKIQTFRAETLTTRKAVFEMENTGRVSQFDLFKKYEVGPEAHRAIFEHAASRGLFCFSTPSHPTDTDLLEKLGSRAYKIGSDDAVNIPFIRHAARKGKPILLSTGMCTLDEVKASVAAITAEGNEEIILFHCTTSYPCRPESVNLAAMLAMQAAFPFPVGYSDHTLGIDVCYAAAVLGAPILEFHFTLDKKADGPDHMLSKDPVETAELARKVRQLPIVMGDGVKRPAPAELPQLRNNRKSLVVIRDVAAGAALGVGDFEARRPGTGIACARYDEVLGRKAKRALAAGEVLAWDDLA
ncbi:MAG: N-acetylneuraminate synthase family protein [Elusimicrobia bacterium]|nr:N-acetylneuraminate synthase family protein [Elusimicrobiota bacterium]